MQYTKVNNQNDNSFPSFGMLNIKRYDIFIIVQKRFHTVIKHEILLTSPIKEKIISSSRTITIVIAYWYKPLLAVRLPILQQRGKTIIKD